MAVESGNLRRDLMSKESVLYKNRKGDRLISAILYLLTPFAFMANPLLFVVCVTAQLVLQTLHGYRFSELFVVLLLNGFVYSSVSFAGLRFYDWIIIFSFAYVFINKRGHVAIPVRLLIFITSVFLVFLFHGMKTNEILEVVRYFVSILLIVVVLNTKPDMNLISESIIRICKVMLYNAIIVFAMIQLGRVHNYMSSFISTNVYIYSDEVRLNGFFSDPNKYMTFCLALLFIIDVFVENPTYKRNGILILSIATVLSMSRTALLCLGLYFFVKLLLKLKEKSPVLFGCCIITFSVVCILLLATPDIINSIINELYTLAARLLGREHTLEINATMKDDNRVYVWGKAIQFISQKPFWGNGWLAYQSLLPYPTHNTIVSLLLDGGAFVLTAYLYTFWPLFSNKRFGATISCVILPMLLLDLGNYRVLFLLLALIMLPSKGKAMQ